MRAALADVSPKAAFWRPAPDRHNIAEVALHHAWVVRSVTGQLSGTAPEPFPLEGEDWFEVSNGRKLSWPAIKTILEEHQARLAEVVANIDPAAVAERFDLVLGVTCHAVYHAGQVQLLKVLGG
jgi:hypothetical protein